MDARTAGKWVLPVDLAASSGPVSTESTVSESSFDMMASVNMTMARAPANGLPNPTAVAKKTAQIKSGMVRITFMKLLAAP